MALKTMLRIAVISLGIGMISSAAFAAPSPVLAIPGSADAARIIPDNTALPQPMPVEKPAVTAPPTPVVNAPPGAEQVHFVLTHITIEGMTAYKPADIAPLYNHYLHQQISLATIYQIAAAITNRYQEDGYSLSRAAILPQKIKDGQVTIRVVEGYINDVTMEGAYHHSAIVEKIVARLKSMKPLKLLELERTMLILNDMGNVAVHALLRAPTDQTVEAGAVNLALVFEDLKPNTSITFDNSGSRYVGPYETSAQTTFTTPLAPYQQTTINGLMTVPPREMQYGQASQRVLLASNGTSATIQITGVHDEPQYHLENEHIVSTAVDSSMMLSYPVIRSRAQNLYIDGEFAINNNVTDTSGNLLTDDRLRILRLSTRYDNSDSFKGSNTAEIKLSQGLDILDETKTGSADLSRAAGHSDFTKITANLGRLQSITDRTSIYIAGQGQYAWNPLLSSEQMGFGGQQFGRAYDNSAFTGDDGIEGMAELRYALQQQVWHLQSEPFLFSDVGRVWDYDAYNQGQTAASVGIGWRVTNQHSLTAAVTIAEPLLKPVSAPVYGNGYTPRLFVSLSYLF